MFRAEPRFRKETGMLFATYRNGLAVSFRRQIQHRSLTEHCWRETSKNCSVADDIPL
jgi:hypothetical protein